MPDEPASHITALKNALKIAREGRTPYPDQTSTADAHDVTRELRQELADKGIKGFKRGGKVKKTGVAKVHKGERVLTKAQAKKPAVKRAVASKQAVKRAATSRRKR